MEYWFARSAQAPEPPLPPLMSGCWNVRLMCMLADGCAICEIVVAENADDCMRLRNVFTGRNPIPNCKPRKI